MTYHMSFFRKLFGGSSGRAKPAPPPPVPDNEPPIKAYDKFGREILVPRRQWLENVLLPTMENVWNDADRLADSLISAFNDGFFCEVESAARHLCEIDSNPARSVVLLGIIYLQSGRPETADTLFNEYLRKHGEDGVVLTNLAKAQAALGREEESVRTLWHALELDSNQDNAVGWYEVIHREKGGAEEGVAALRRIAALPGSWRAQLWLARHALESRDLDSAMALYREALEAADSPVPTDLLQQMSGDLGNHGYLPELLTLTKPRFDIAVHGLLVGNNLIKACIDTGQLDAARDLVRQHQLQQRPDWRPTLDMWESELSKAHIATMTPLAQERLEVTLLSIPGPIWLKSAGPIADLFPAPPEGAPGVVIFGSTFETPRMSSHVTAQPSDHPGRMSRALPLYLSERLFINCAVSATAFIPWIRNGDGGFVVSGVPTGDADAVEQGRMAGQGKLPDVAITCHLVVRGENYTLRVRVIRGIDARCIAELSYDFAEGAFHPVASRLMQDVTEALGKEIDLPSSSIDPGIDTRELDHYLFRTEQTLAAACSAMEGVGGTFLSNPAEILDGMIHLGLQNPTHVPSRMLLLRCLKAFSKPEPALLRALRPKVDALMSEYPLPDPVQSILLSEIDRAFEG